jgi:hypothetical protein
VPRWIRQLDRPTRRRVADEEPLTDGPVQPEAEDRAMVGDRPGRSVGAVEPCLDAPLADLGQRQVPEGRDDVAFDDHRVVLEGARREPLAFRITQTLDPRTEPCPERLARGIEVQLPHLDELLPNALRLARRPGSSPDAPTVAHRDRDPVAAVRQPDHRPRAVLAHVHQCSPPPTTRG